MSHCQEAEQQTLLAGSCFGRARLSAQIIAACRGKSKADVISKLAIVEEEADETIYWLDLLIESKIVEASRIESLLKETNEVVAMVVASIKTHRGR